MNLDSVIETLSGTKVAIYCFESELRDQRADEFFFAADLATKFHQQGNSVQFCYGLYPAHWDKPGGKELQRATESALERLTAYGVATQLFPITEESSTYTEIKAMVDETRDTDVAFFIQLREPARNSFTRFAIQTHKTRTGSEVPMLVYPIEPDQPLTLTLSNMKKFVFIPLMVAQDLVNRYSNQSVDYVQTMLTSKPVVAAKNLGYKVLNYILSLKGE